MTVTMQSQGAVLPFPKVMNLHTFLFSNPYANLSNPNPTQFPDHTFQGQSIPPHRPCLVLDGSGAQLSFSRLRSDSLKLARSLTAIIGRPVGFTPLDSNSNNNNNVEVDIEQPIVAPRATVLLHLSNGLVWPIVALGTVAANMTLCPVSTSLTARELSFILSKARPQVLITSVGSGETQLRAALELLLCQDPIQDNGMVKGDEIREWAQQLVKDWDQGRKETLPFSRQRVWTVDLDQGADYFGSGFNTRSVSVGLDPRDWTHLLHDPPFEQVSSSLDVFQPAVMSEEEQHRRVAFILWTSGTTGQPKGVLLSHKAAVANTISIWESNSYFSGPFRGDYGGGERWIALAPWYHVYGLVTLLLPTIAMGATLILPRSSRKFDLKEYLGLLTKYRATFAHIAPTVAVALASSSSSSPLFVGSSDFDLSSVRGFLTGGAPVANQVIQKVYQQTGKCVHIGFGTTETMSTAQTRDPSIASDQLGSTGIPVSNNLIRIHSETNEILIQSPTTMLGYYSGLSSESSTSSSIDKTLTSSAFYHPGKWYRTGDLGRIDTKGQIWITGRSKEIIKIRGFQVSPSELDHLLVQHSQVSDAATTGIQQQDDNDQVLILIVPKDLSILKNKLKLIQLAKELSDWVTDLAAYYKWPSYYLFSDTVPRNASGKIVRNQIEAWKGIKIAASKPSRPAKL